MRTSNKKYIWYNNVLKAIGQYRISMDFYPSIKTRKQISSLCSTVYWTQWQSSRKPYYNLLSRPELKDTSKSLMTIYFRIKSNDKWSITGTTNSNICPVCSKEWKSWLFHITYLCQGNTGDANQLKTAHGLLSEHQIETEEFPSINNSKDIISTVQNWCYHREQLIT